MKTSFWFLVPVLALAGLAQAASKTVVAPSTSSGTVTAPLPHHPLPVPAVTPKPGPAPSTPAKSPTAPPPASKPSTAPRPTAPAVNAPVQSPKPSTGASAPKSTLPPAKPHPKATRRAARGTVASVDVAANKISVTTAAKKTQDFVLDKSCRITLDKKSAKLADILPGQKVLVAYDVITNKAVLVQASTK